MRRICSSLLIVNLMYCFGKLQVFSTPESLAGVFYRGEAWRGWRGENGERRDGMRFAGEFFCVLFPVLSRSFSLFAFWSDNGRATVTSPCVIWRLWLYDCMGRDFA